MSRLLIPLAILAALILPGCSGTPTEIEGGVVIFEGVIETLGRQFHSFAVTTEGGVEVEALSVTAIPELEGLTPNVGVGVGEPAEEDAEIQCNVTHSVVMTTGTRIALGLQERTYCLVVFDNGTMEEGAQRVYAIQVSPTES